MPHKPLLAAFLMALMPAIGMSSPPSDAHLTSGLVLSGGGARGLAHIGVLKVL